MLILRNQTLIPRTRKLHGSPLRFRLDDASEAGGARLAVILIT